MFNWIKRNFGGVEDSEKEVEYDFRWYEIDDKDNPFNKKILDIRSFTNSIVATTESQEIAESFVRLRESDGKYLLDQKIENEISITSNLEYEHNGDSLDGIVFKSEAMECKWDIYCYDSCFYFARSWSGELFFKSPIQITEDKISITKIFFDGEKYDEDVVNDIHFLIKSHALNQPFPHKVPNMFSDEKKIALFSFSQYGNRACYACFEDITDTIIKLPE